MWDARRVRPIHAQQACQSPFRRLEAALSGRQDACGHIFSQALKLVTGREIFA